MLRLQDNDTVIVKDGIEDGYSLPQPLYSSSNTLRIEMITGDAGNDLGFVLQYKVDSYNKTRTSSPKPTPEVTTMRNNDVTWSKQPNFITASHRQSSSMKTTGEVCSCCRLNQVEVERGNDGKLIAIGFAIGVTVSLTVTAIVLIVAKVVYQRHRDSTKRHEKGGDLGAYVNTDIEVQDSAYTTLQLNEMNQSTYESLNSATKKSNRDQND
ncbi:uncharacterized protein [Ptychodera flava]|uniref:uncharacterized protein n=1 Tax=Ptychodera flava TaxID=63121 RepID=UPI00396A7A3A